MFPSSSAAASPSTDPRLSRQRRTSERHQVPHAIGQRHVWASASASADRDPALKPVQVAPLPFEQPRPDLNTSLIPADSINTPSPL